MSDPKAGPTEKVAWIAAGLSLVASALFVVSAFIGRPNLLTVLAAAMTGISGGIWVGRALEAKAVRTGRNQLRS